MARQKTYYELLRDPRWQRRRLEIMERAEFSCERCESKTTTLNVHHTYYEKSRKPWEYPDESLQCLCETCHEETTQLLAKIHREMGQLSWEGLQQVYGYIQSVRSSDDQWDEAAPVLDCMGLSCAQGLADHYHLQDFLIIDIIQRDGHVTAFSMQQAESIRDHKIIRAILETENEADAQTIAMECL